jgi:hypothetical protein
MVISRQADALKAAPSGRLRRRQRRHTHLLVDVQESIVSLQGQALSQDTAIPTRKPTRAVNIPTESPVQST